MSEVPVSAIDTGEAKAALGKNGHGYNALADILSLKDESPSGVLSADRETESNKKNNLSAGSGKARIRNTSPYASARNSTNTKDVMMH